MKKLLTSLLIAVMLLSSIAMATDTHIPWEQDGAVLEEPCLTLDPWQPTFMSPEQMEILWPGMGQELHDLEVVWSINAIFCAAVAQIESGKTNPWHNFFGIKAGRDQASNAYGFRTWESPYDGVLGFGKYIRTSGYYPVGSSIETIAKTYCDPSWAYPVYSEMRYLIQKVEEGLR